MIDVKGFFDNNIGRWYDVFLQRARNGKQFLMTKEDKAEQIAHGLGNGWRLSSIDVGKLHMQSPWNCAAAQFCGTGYHGAIVELGLIGDPVWSRDLGFIPGNDVIDEIMRETGWGEGQANEWAYGQLTLAWLEVLGGNK